MKKRRLTKFGKFIIVFTICFLFGSSLSFYCLLRKSVKTSKKSSPKTEVVSKKEMDVSLVMVGDALIHDTIYNDAYSDYGYDFKPMLRMIKPIVAKYDLKYYNQETVLGDTSLGLSSYPRFNSPYEVGDAFIDSSFNLVSLATNHTMDKGEEGALNSYHYFQNHKDVYTAGSYDSFEARNKVVIKEIKGIKYAFFAYTTWTNGLSTPEGKEYLNNVYSDEVAKNDILKVKDEVDVIIVAMHWGIEYSTDVSSDQERIANYLASLGVNIIIGSHPHVVEPIDFIGNTMVVYSLGNFISDQDTTLKLTGLMASVDIHKEVNNDKVTIELRNPQAELLYTSSAKRGKRNFVVYPYTELTDEILPNYKTYYNQYKSIVLAKNQNIKMPVIE